MIETSCAPFKLLSAHIEGTVQFFLFVIASYFFVIFVYNIASAQWKYATGSPYQYTESWQNIVVLVILLAFASSYKEISQALYNLFATTFNANGCSFGEITFTSIQIAVSDIVNFFVRIIVGFSIVSGVTYVVWSVTKASGANLLGLPSGVSQALTKMILMLFGVSLTLLSTVIAQGILSLF